jgi:hypothetical protein
MEEFVKFEDGRIVKSGLWMESVRRFETLEEVVSYFQEKGIPFDQVEIGSDFEGPREESNDDEATFFWPVNGA